MKFIAGGANDLRGWQAFKRPTGSLANNSDTLLTGGIKLVTSLEMHLGVRKAPLSPKAESARLIHIKSPIINEKDLVEALKDEKIAGAGLDVFEKEPLPQDHKLRFLPNALLLPHIGYVTAENYSKFYSQMIENLESCLKNKPLRIIS